MPYWRGAPRRAIRTPARRERGTRASRALIDGVRDRVRQGEGCWFHGRPGYEDCPKWIDLELDGRRDRWALTVHHLDRVMDGGPVVADPDRVAPAHRACNSRDGLRAQNRRRTGRPETPERPPARYASRVW